MKLLQWLCAIGALSSALAGLAGPRAEAQALGADTSPRSAGPSVALRWNEAALQGVRESKLGPPMVARALGLDVVNPSADSAQGSGRRRSGLAQGARIFS